MSPIAASHPSANDLLPAALPAGAEGASALIDRRTALLTLGLSTAALLAIWTGESIFGVIADIDRWAEPALALVMALLFLVLWRFPSTQLLTQRLAVLAVAAYFVLNAITLQLRPVPVAALHEGLALMLWLPVLFLMLFASWNARWASGLALLVLACVLAPSLAIWQAPLPIADGRPASLLLLNGAVALGVLLSGLASLSRLHRGLHRAPDVHPSAQPQDARDAIEGWVELRTADLARAKEAAEAASQAKSRFLAVMSHELRTPLHAVLASAELLRDSLQPGATAPGDPAAAASRDAALIETIRRSGTHLLTLIDEVLELSRIEAGKLEITSQPFELGDVAEQALQAVRQQAYDKGLKLSSQFEHPLIGTRRGDALRVTQVLINLLANAVKFTERGEVELRVEARGQDGLRFIVRDTGPGLSPEQQVHVFDAFHQADSRSTRQHGGAGLGLTITRELVNLMNGKLELHSAPGQGTRIEVSLPLPPVNMVPLAAPQPLAGTASPVARDAMGSSAQLLQGRKVLVVEDDPVNSMLAVEMLRSAGAQAEAVDSGPAALAWLRQHNADVVLMDWRMPGMDGLEVTRRMRQGQGGPLGRTVPVIGLTANAFAEDRDACLAAGMNHVLTKPIERNRLIGDVSRVIETGTAG